MKSHIFNRITLSVTLLAFGAFCPNVRADWGSLHGNNRSPGAPIQSAPRPQPPVNRAPPQTFRAPPPQVREPQPAVRPEPPRQETQPVVREQPHIVEPARPVPVVREQQPVPARAQAAETDRRRMDIDEDRRQSFFWSDYHAGMRIDRLPDGYRRFRIHDHDYFYFGGVYYDSGPSGYVVVNAPVDADIPELPPGAETVEANGTVYYYVDGVFYVQQADGSYVVVAAPMGVTVSMLPSDAVPVGVNGTTYYQADMTYYL
ncbi:MAG TPA: DUF6515 family protein, partial [Verrucomicrobiae bacterium]